MRLLAVAIGVNRHRGGETRNLFARLSPSLYRLLVIGFPGVIQTIVPDTLDGLCFVFTERSAGEISICGDQIRSGPVRSYDAQLAGCKVLQWKIRVLRVNE